MRNRLLVCASLQSTTPRYSSTVCVCVTMDDGTAKHQPGGGRQWERTNNIIMCTLWFFQLTFFFVSVCYVKCLAAINCCVFPTLFVCHHDFVLHVRPLLRPLNIFEWLLAIACNSSSHRQRHERYSGMTEMTASLKLKASQRKFHKRLP